MKEKLGHYQLRSELGRGGMGVVYKAFDPTLNRDVAIKVLSERLSSDDSVVERFTREAKSMAALNDAHIIQIYFIGDDEGQPFFVMEFVDGESLSQRLKRDGKLSLAEAKRILLETAKGLKTAHDRGVVHRDIKPGNLMLTEQSLVKIADFGIAMVQDFSKRLTNTGEFVGTPGYLSPEVCIGQPVDHRSDIFAMGIVFYEMLTGRIPFTEASPLGMMLEVVKADIPDVRTVNAEVDDRSCDILERMIAKDPDRRYQNCGELITDLQGTAAVSRPSLQQPTGTFQSAATQALKDFDIATPELEAASPSAARTLVSSPGQEMVTQMRVRRSKSALPLSLGLVLLLGVGAASAYWWRDSLFPSQQKVAEAPPAVPVESVATTQASSTSTVPATAADPTLANNSTLAQDIPSEAELEAELRRWSAEQNNSSTNPSQQSTTGGQAAAGGGGGAVAVASGGKAVAGSGGAFSLVAEAQDETEHQVAESSEQKVLDQPASSPKAMTVAKVTKPAAQQRIVAPPLVERHPRVVVMVLGEPAISGPVEQLLESVLTRDRHDLVDEDFFPGIGRYDDGSAYDIAALAALVQDNGADVLILGEIDYLGETPLQYYGEYSILYSVNLRVRSILLSERRPLGPGWTQKIDFTALNANEKAKEAVDPILDQVSASLQGVKIAG